MNQDDLERIRAAANGSDNERSIRWYRDQVRKLGILRGNPLSLSIGRQANTVAVGNMYLFVYEPKYMDTLPYYDIFPLVLPFDYTKNGFRGLNLHYVPPLARVEILQELMEISRVRRLTPDTKLRMSWEILSSAAVHPLIAPTVKQYLYSHIRSSLMRIEAPDWKIAALLPLENFQNKTRLGVFQMSRKKAR